MQVKAVSSHVIKLERRELLYFISNEERMSSYRVDTRHIPERFHSTQCLINISQILAASYSTQEGRQMISHFFPLFIIGDICSKRSLVQFAKTVISKPHSAVVQG